MIAEAAQRKKEQELAAKKHERELVMQLQKDIASEKQARIQKRDQQREQARQVIAENEKEKAKRLLQEKESQQRDAELIKKEMAAREAADQAREQKMRERDEKIAKIMAKMGEAGVRGNKDKEQMRQAERDYIEQCIAKDE